MKLSPQDVTELLEREGAVTWTTMARLLGDGSQSCVDGRGECGVLGTPGGDAGEYLLALVCIERVTGAALPDDALPELFDRFIKHFGRFYMHTDCQAVNALAKALNEDPLFADVGGDAKATAALLRDPGERGEQLLPYLLDPAHVGCGHLKLILLHPEEYHVRRGLAEALLRTVFRKLWAGADINYVVLEGRHDEGAVVQVYTGRPTRTFSRVPLITPTDGEQQMFIAHPAATRWVRQKMALYLCSDLPELSAISPEGFAFEVNGLAHVQLGLTLGYLAEGLPVYTATLSEGGPVKVT